MNRAGNGACAARVRELVNTPVPVELVSFSAELDGGAVVMRWATAAEIDNLGFNILRQSNAREPYDVVNSSMITARGCSAQGADYRFVDESAPFGSLDYLLEDVSFEGRTERHGPVRVTVPRPGRLAMIDISRNPTTEPVAIRSHLLTEHEASVRVYSLTGALLRHLTAQECDAGVGSVIWDLKDARGQRVSPSVYIIAVGDALQTARTGLVVAK